MLDRAEGIEKVSVREIVEDDSEAQLRYEPNHPLADAKGYVRYPDINPILEMADLRDAERSYKANMQIVESAKRLLRTTLDVIR
jgi:flagellar basal-body rod protein FlgC